LEQIVGATEIVEQLPRRTLDQVVEALGLEGRFDPLSRAAGQARLLFSRREDADRLAAVWPMACRLRAPGLEVVQAVVPVARGYLAAVQEAEERLRIARNQPAGDLPEIPPLAKRNSRTGLAAVPVPRGFGTDELDGPGLAKVEARRAARQDPQGRVLPEVCQYLGCTKAEQVPTTFGQISGPEREYLAVVHADGNGFGEMFVALAAALEDRPFLDGVKEFYHDLSLAIERFARQAAKAALPRFDGVWPVLPIVLAGDDLTLVMRASLAFGFVENYLEAFGSESKKELDVLRTKHPGVAEAVGRALPARLSAGAGIAFVKPHYPYAAAGALAESLARFAKNGARRARLEDGGIPATVAFHRVTASSSSDDFGEILEGELTSADRRTRLTLAPYAVGQMPSLRPLPPLAALRKLAEALGDLPSSKTREILSQLSTNQMQAVRLYERLIEVAREGPAPQREAALSCEQRLRELTGVSPGRCPLLTGEKEGQSGTPLGDALVWGRFRGEPSKQAPAPTPLPGP
jgi:hypothetical protein